MSENNSTDRLKTGISVWGDRHFPAQNIADSCRALVGAGVDAALIPDQITNFIPRQLWTPENAPMAAFIPDVDSHSDALMMAGYAAASTSGLEIHVSTDAVRRPPVETVQALLTLANMTEGRAVFQVGAGEIKQSKPFGHPTNQGISRMDDLFQIYRRFVESSQPITFKGRRWELDRASIGSARTHPAQLWALGGGPMLSDYATSYADGIILAVRANAATPESTAARVEDLRAQVAAKGRDPQSFKIGVWAGVMLHEDSGYIDRAFENPILKYMTGTLGRIEPSAWQAESLPVPVPENWAYYKDLLPYEMTDDHVKSVVATVTRDHCDRAWFHGSSISVAQQIQPFLENGVDWVVPIDYLGMVGGPEEAQASFARSIEVCTELKRLAGATAG